MISGKVSAHIRSTGPLHQGPYPSVTKVGLLVVEDPAADGSATSAAPTPRRRSDAEIIALVKITFVGPNIVAVARNVGRRLFICA
jgi:hypothetical protein